MNRLFKKDSTVTKYQALEAFMTFKRLTNMSIQAYLNEFDEYNSFTDTPNQLSPDQDHDTYYTRGSYGNYQQKPNLMNRLYQHNTHPKTSPIFKVDKNLIEEEKTHVTKWYLAAM